MIDTIKQLVNPGSTSKKVASNTIYQLLGKIITMTITIVVTAIITRYYGRQGYGEFNLMQTYPALFFIIVDFGLSAVATKEISKDWSQVSRYLGNLIVLRFAFALTLIGIAAFVVSFMPYTPSLLLGIYLSLFLILTQAMYATTNIIFQAKLRYDISALGLVAGSITTLALVLYLAFNSYSVMWLSFSYVIGGLITFVVSIYFIMRLGINVTLGFDKSLWRYLLVQSWPLGLTFVFSQVNFRADSLMLSAMNLPEKYNLTNTEAVAIYGLPYKVFDVLLVLPTFFMNASYPIYIKHLAEGRQRLKATVATSLKLLFILGLVTSVLGIAFAPLIINLLGGREFTQSVLVLRLLMLGLCVFYLTQPLSWAIVTLGRQKLLPKIYLIAALFNIAANFFFIPRYSFYASSILTWSSELVILILLIYYARKVWGEYNA